MSNVQNRKERTAFVGGPIGETIDTALERAAAPNNKPVEGFDNSTETDNVITATLDVMVVSGPAWFEAARKVNKTFSFLEVPSREFLMELYGKAYSFREEVDKSLNAGEGAADKPIPPAAGADDAVGGGAFGGLSSE
jgi:hypothetical protein